MSDPILSPRSSFQDNVLIIEDDGHSFEEEIHQTQLESARKFLWDDDVLNSSGKSLPHFRTAQIPSLGLLDVQDFDQEDIDLQEDNDIEVQEDKEIDFHFQEDKDTDFREDKEENKGDTSRTTLVFTQIPKILDEDELPKSKSSSTQRTSLSIQATSLVPSVFKRKSGFNGDGYDDFLFVDKSLVQDSFDYSTGNKRKYRCVRALMAICLLASLLIWALFYTNMYASFGIKETMNTERFEALTIKLVEDHSVPELALGTAGSPQNNALHWIANQDPSQIDIEDKFLIQRYALAVLFFATSGTPAYGYFAVPGSDWVNQANWMTREGYCGWHGVECVGNLTDGNADVFGLNLTSNGLVGNLVPEIEVFKKLDRLDMSLNELGGTIPVELAQLRSLLRSVSLYGNNFTGPILENFGAMTNLRELDLGSNSLTGEMPESLGEATSLKKLNLEENNLNGTISSNWEYMTKLEFLYLNSNNFDGQVPKRLFGLTNLKVLQLGENELIGSIPDQLRNLDNLKSLHLHENNFDQGLPDLFERLTNLVELSIHGNDFTGVLPETIKKLTKMERFLLDNNKFSGKIHTNLEHLHALKVLQFHHNEMTGEIPNVFGTLTNLEVLKLNNNEFAGSIPDSLGLCTGLRELFLEDNALDGHVPTNLGGLQNLERLSLEANGLTGAMSEEVCDLLDAGGLDYLSADCDKGHGIVCDCCTQCF